MSKCSILELTLTLIKPEIVKLPIIRDQIIARIKNEGFEIAHQRTLTLSKLQAEHFYSPHVHKYYFSRAVKYITEGPVIACILSKINAIEDFKVLVRGREGCREDSLRALYGTSETVNAVHASQDSGEALREIKILFPNFSVDSHLISKV